MEAEIGSDNGKSSGCIRLRRKRIVDVANEGTIEENLKTLQMGSLAKRTAQNLYYNSNKSPLRAYSTNSKLPIQARLGTKRLRRGPFSYPTNNNVLLKPNTIRLRRQNRGRKNIAHFRMQALRQEFFKAPPRLKLQRTRSINPRNYTVQVNNSAAFNKFQPFQQFNKHSCVADLNPKFQEEIRIIQSENEHPIEVIPQMAIYTIGYGCTDVKLHHRFSV